MNDITTPTKSKKELEAIDGEEFLNLDYDSVSDLEGFKPMPSGVYSFSVTNCEVDEVGKDKKTAIVMEMEITGYVELEEETEETLAELPEFPYEYKEMMFLTGSKIGGKAFVTMTRQLKEDNGWTSIMEGVNGVIGYTGTALIKKRKWVDDSDETRYNNQIDSQTVIWG